MILSLPVDSLEAGEWLLLVSCLLACFRHQTTSGSFSVYTDSIFFALTVRMQELEKVSLEKSRLEAEGEKQAAKFKTVEEDRNRLQKSASTQQSAVLKQKQIVDDLKSKLTAAETQASTFKRQNEQLQRDVKSQQSNVGATEVSCSGANLATR